MALGVLFGDNLDARVAVLHDLVLQHSIERKLIPRETVWLVFKPHRCNRDFDRSAFNYVHLARIRPDI